MEVYVDDEAKLTLHGLQQHYVKLKDAEKNRKLFELLDVLEFNQVVIFVKSVQRCVALAQLLIEQNFPAIAIHRGMGQEERLSRYQQFKDFQKVTLTIIFLILSPWMIRGHLAIAMQWLQSPWADKPFTSLQSASLENWPILFRYWNEHSLFFSESLWPPTFSDVAWTLNV